MNMIESSVTTLMGFAVRTSPFVQPVPKIQIDPDFKWCTPAFRAEMNEWLLQRFGTYNVAYMMSGPLGKGLFINPEHMAMLKNSK